MSSSLFQLFYSDDVAGAAAILSRDGLRTVPTSIAGQGGKDSKLTKQDINKRDALGRTVLHLAASKGSLDFVRALLENPTTDVNLLDLESGWCNASIGPMANDQVGFASCIVPWTHCLCPIHYYYPRTRHHQS